MRSRSSHRRERVATLIQQVVAQALATKVKDPRVGFVTVTGVSVSADFTHATIQVSVMGDDDDKEKAMSGLESARGFLRSIVAGAADLKVAPDLHFILDRGLEHASRINELLAIVKRNEPPS